MELLKRVRDALLTVTKDVHHFEKTGSEERYIVWQEGIEGDSLHADDKHEIIGKGLPERICLRNKNMIRGYRR